MKLHRILIGSVRVDVVKANQKIGHYVVVVFVDQSKHTLLYI